MFPETEILIMLFAAATFAGFVDAIAGGGGLITIPALLLSGLSPAHTVATNKLQGMFGSLSATITFARKGAIDIKLMMPAIITCAIAAGAGSYAVRLIDPQILAVWMPLMLIAIALYFAFSPQVTDFESKARTSFNTFVFLVAPIIAFYDGFFGPGTGSFFFAAIVFCLGFDARRATGNTKLLNFTTNISSLLVFLMSGNVMWRYGLPMIFGQILGAWIGSHTALRFGAKLIRPLVVIVSLAVAAKLVSSPTHPFGVWFRGLF